MGAVHVVKGAAPAARVVPETPLERRIVEDPELIRGAAWGKPRSGHPAAVTATATGPPPKQPGL
jgi:hypothetical protein